LWGPPLREVFGTSQQMTACTREFRPLRANTSQPSIASEAAFFGFPPGAVKSTISYAKKHVFARKRAFFWGADWV
jgi:hypothetical protein